MVPLIMIIGPPGLFLIRALLLSDPMHAAGLLGLAETVFSLALAGLHLFLASSLGTSLLKQFERSAHLTSLERHLFAFSLGNAAIGVIVMVLGLLHIIHGWVIVLLLSVLGALTWQSGQAWLRGFIALLEDARMKLRAATAWHHMLFIALFGILLASLAAALTPPKGYDALMYHLEGARSIYEHHGFFPDLNNWWNNYPFLVQMLFLVGLAFDSDVLARLINLGFGISLLGVTLALAKRLRPRREAWFTNAALLGIPAFALWASFAYVDLANATFVGLAALALVLWRDQSTAWPLVYSGIMTGLALASKYTSVLDAGLLTLAVLWLLRAWRNDRRIRGFISFAAPALLLAAPWYLKNWIWMGSPIFPTYLIQPQPLTIRNELNTAYVLHGFGTGSEWMDFLVLPIQLYQSSLAYGQFALEMPSLLFPFLLLVPLAWRSVSKPMLVLALTRFALWAVTTQQMRFLLTTFVILSLLFSDTIHGLLKRSSRITELSIKGIVLGVVLASGSAGVVRIGQLEPWSVVLGLESREVFLRRELAGYQARMYIEAHLPSEARVFLVGDGRRYYCPPQCDPVVDQFGWTGVAIESGFRVDQTIERLCSGSFTHLLVSWPDVNYLLAHDVDGRILESMKLLLSDLMIDRLERVFEEEDAALFALPCPDLSAASR